ncbi:phage holin family protein [Rhodococcoides yunnanense]|uniref:phage holin family protein n=1 Tax=Rhodococcoides yunnanense TaxID=278209 RepID=UPI000933937E|nr:phage holin family protein [Rhodococcus yunnanensis]
MASGRRTVSIGSIVVLAWEYWVLTAACAVALIVADLVMPGFHLDRIGSSTFLGLVASGVVLSIVFGALNAILWPLLLRAMMWAGPALLFVFVFVASGLMMLLSVVLVPVAHFDGPVDATTLALVLSLTTSVISGAMAARRDTTYRTMVVRRHRVRARTTRPSATGPGLVCIQLDGLGHDVLRRAMSSGVTPTLARLVASGSHSLVPWHTDWSSQTGSSQLGILHGSNRDVPAFRWYDKTTSRIAVFSDPASNLERERERSDIPGLLAGDGASRGNLFSGGAEDNVLVVSRMKGARLGGGGSGYSGYFIDPANAVRTAIRLFAEVCRELGQAWSARRHDIVPRVSRGGIYPLVRAFTTVVETDVVVAAVIGDMVRGRTIVYADLVGYDEVSHHSGIERPETLAVLRKLDAELAMIHAVAESSDRPYRLVVLSDHGQSQGATFSQRYGESLKSLVLRQCDGASVAEEPARAGGGEGAGYAAASVGLSPAPDRALRDNDDAVVLASGNVGSVSFPHIEGRATKETIEEKYPRLLQALIDHPGIGFVLVARGDGGSIVLSGSGSVELATGVVSGTDPLQAFGSGVLDMVRRTDSFGNVPDIMINGTYWAETDEIAAFEEQVGSHGGLGGQQTTPFLLFPTAFDFPPLPLHGAESIHRILSSWRDRADGSPAISDVSGGVVDNGAGSAIGTTRD